MTPRPLRRSVATLTAAVLTALLAACSGGSTGSATSTLPTHAAEASGTSSASPTVAAPATAAFQAADPKGIGLIDTFSGITPTTSRQKAVYRAWSAYRLSFSQAVNGKVDWPRITASTSGVSLRSVGYELTMRTNGTIGGKSGQGKLYTVGKTEYKLTSINDSAKTATISYCTNDESYEIDKTGATIVPSPGISKITDQLRKIDGVWKVDHQISAVHDACTMT